jgi:hypothetical protein
MCICKIERLSIKMFLRCTKYKTNLITLRFVHLAADPCGRTLAGIVGSNPTGDMDVCLLRAFVLSRRSLCVGQISSPRGVVPTVVCVWMLSSENKQPRHLLWVGRRAKDYKIFLATF